MAGLDPHTSSRAGHEVTELEGQGACENNNAIKSGVDEVFVGIDWGASHRQLCAVNATGQRATVHP